MQGLFAKEKIGKGEVICFPGKIHEYMYTLEQVQETFAPDEQVYFKDHAVEVSPGVYVGTRNAQEGVLIVHIFNHSCESNICISLLGYALRDIEAGEELTLDYAANVCYVIIELILKHSCK